ncbi:MAG TPA: fasciclin domain-containing protein [Caulobacteraceae bacterium]|nr:fasciclin domain-containing protein [Caulobacteraceae bacterium]
MMHRLMLAGAFALVLAAPALAQDAQPAAPAAPPPPAAAAPAAPSIQLTPSGDIIGTLKASGQFTILLKALDAANLTAFLQGAGPYTLLAPTDDAFKALPAGQLDSLMQPANAAQLQALLAYHIIAVGVPPSKVQGTKGPIPTAAGPDVQIDGSATPFKANDADIVGQATVSNGDVYVVDKVLMPQAAASAASSAAPAAAATQ